MAIKKIVKLGCPILKQKTGKVQKCDGKITQLVRDMFHTMYDAPGVGLSANQIGVGLQVAVVDVIPGGVRNPIALINPVIQKKTGRICEEEGCLSIPGVLAKVKRSAKIKVCALDEFGKEFTLEAEGLLSRAVQHEMDHLNGVVFVDRLSPLKKLKARMQIRKLKKEHKW